jgi:hypothetical protein
MALVLGARVGDAFFIGRRRIVIRAVYSPDQVKVERDDGAIHTVGPHQWTEVFHDVFIRTGLKPVRGYIRLQFEAPQTVLIGRDSE